MTKLKTPPENPYEVAMHEEPKSTDRSTEELPMLQIRAGVTYKNGEHIWKG